MPSLSCLHSLLVCQYLLVSFYSFISSSCIVFPTLLIIIYPFAFLFQLFSSCIPLSFSLYLPLSCFPSHLPHTYLSSLLFASQHSCLKFLRLFTLPLFLFSFSHNIVSSFLYLLRLWIASVTRFSSPICFLKYNSLCCILLIICFYCLFLYYVVILFVPCSHVLLV